MRQWVTLVFVVRKKLLQPLLLKQHTKLHSKLNQKEKQYGFARLYAGKSFSLFVYLITSFNQKIKGVKTTESSYSTPIISLHTYTKAQNAITRTNTILGATNQGNISHSGPSSSTNTKKETTKEKVRCIPIEDIISVTYSTDSKEQYETLETTQERARAPKGKLGCCGSIKKCLRETYCCCPKCPCDICKPPKEEAPKYDRNRRQNMTANRMILVEIKCIPYSNIHIPSYVQVLPDDQKMKFYKENFDVDTIEFYLFNNNETDKNNFDAKRNEADALSRVILQLRNMVFYFIFFINLNNVFILLG